MDKINMFIHLYKHTFIHSQDDEGNLSTKYGQFKARQSVTQCGLVDKKNIK